MSELVADVLLQRVRVRSCVYCGGLTRGRLTCPAHGDLPAVDPVYASARVVRLVPEPAGPLTGSTAGSETNGG